MNYEAIIDYLIKERGSGQYALRIALVHVFNELKTLAGNRSPLGKFSHDKSLLFPGSREEFAPTGITVTCTSNGMLYELFEEIGVSGTLPMLLNLKDALDALVATEATSPLADSDERQKFVSILDYLLGRC